MTSRNRRENWFKGTLALGITKDAIIPFLEDHYKQTLEEWNTDDNHLEHLLDLGAKNELKQPKKADQKWDVNCSDCKPILEKLMSSYRRGKRPMWMNNTKRSLRMSDEYRLAKIYMSGGKENEDSTNFNEVDTLAILEVCRNDTRLGFCDAAYLILFRNRLMHSCNNCITEEEMTEAFDQMKKLLDNDKLKDRKECSEAITKLEKLLVKPMLWEIEESNENWKEAVSLQKMAIEKENIIEAINPDVLQMLLKDTKAELERQHYERMNIEQMLSYTRSELEKSKNNEQYQRASVDSARRDLENERRYREIEKNNHEATERKLQEEIQELKAQTSSFSGRIAKGSVIGGGVGLFGGPPGAVVGSASGAVVGGVSYFWDKITGK